eukprot:817190-Amphidinium_carterae.2
MSCHDLELLKVNGAQKTTPRLEEHPFVVQFAEVRRSFSRHPNQTQIVEHNREGTGGQWFNVVVVKSYVVRHGCR